ncbi:MAG: HlyD family efflux transporter periplasmic adaptor subunit [Emcibacter sp.]|nr:HlyD family efflux transporter periplasmic adaptor subunit [Emcibacter sp.]
MKIIRERPCQRRYHRLTAPLHVIFEGQVAIVATDWSVGGLGLEIKESHLPKVGFETTVGVILSFQGYDISFNADVIVVRVDKDSALAGFQFVALEERSRDLLNYFSSDLIRGRMGTFEDSICRIDVPVTPISTQPTTSHISETPVRRLPLKTIFMATFYILAGILVFSYVAILIYSNFMRLEVSSSVVSTPLQTLRMPVDGVIKHINFEVGTHVKAGDEILRINDLKLESQINGAKIRIETAQKAIWRMKQKHKIDVERMKLYRIVNRTDKNIAEARLSAKREALNAADAHFIRMTKLKENGIVTTAQYEAARKSQMQAAAAVREAEFILEKNAAMDVASARRHYNHKEFTTDLDMLALDLEMAYSTLEMEVTKLEQLDKIKARLVLRAPFDGRIVNLYQTAYSNVARNAPLLLLEKDNDISITAFLNQKEVLEIGLHDTAKIFIPALNIHLPATVVKIDRSSLFLNKSNTHYTWHDKKDRTAAVILSLQIDAQSISHIHAGLPVVVIFDRRETSDIWSKIKGIVGYSAKANGQVTGGGDGEI